MKDKITDIKDYGLFEDFKILMTKFLSRKSLSFQKLESIYKNHRNTSRTSLRDIIRFLYKLHLIEIENDCIKINSLGAEYKKMTDYEMKKDLITILIEKICEEDDMFIKSLEITYDPHVDAYILKEKLPLKYSALRNMLLQYSIFSYSDNINGGFVINNKYIEVFNNFVIKKTSQTELDLILENKKKAGNTGENFVVEYEKERLNNKELILKVDRISLYDVSAGFDILSFESNKSKSYDRFIEVKTHNGSGCFYWSRNEIDVSKQIGDKYYLYLVNMQKINEIGYEPEIFKNPHENILKNSNWEKTTELISVIHKK